MTDRSLACPECSYVSSWSQSVQHMRTGWEYNLFGNMFSMDFRCFIVSRPQPNAQFVFTCRHFKTDTPRQIMALNLFNHRETQFEFLQQIWKMMLEAMILVLWPKTWWWCRSWMCPQIRIRDCSRQEEVAEMTTASPVRMVVETCGCMRCLCECFLV